MSEWIECTLSDLVSFQRGYDLPKSHMQKGQYPVVGSNGIIGFHNEYTTDEPSITIGRSGNVGKPFIYYGKTWSHNTTLYVKDYKGSDPVFVFYFLKTMDLANYGGGSAVPTLNRNHIHTLSICVPKNVEEQKKIGVILETIDHKILINNAINDNLEQQAQAIFKAWFVDFEPFGGVMPDDWKMVSLSEVADFIGGYSYKGTELGKSDIAMATIKNFRRGGGFKLDGYKEIIPSDNFKSVQYADLFDILVAHTDLTQNAEVIGNAEIILNKSKYDNIIFSMDLVKVVPKKDKISKFIIASILKNENFKHHCLGYINGTTVLHLSKRALNDYKFALPNDLLILKPLEKILSLLYENLALNTEQTMYLTSLRDTLLPKLMSGEIDVSNIEI